MKTRIPVARPDLGEAEWQAVRRVIESGWVTQGPMVAEFERAMADFCESEEAVAVSSCTTALHLSLLAAGIGPGDEVIVPSMSFIATANVVHHAGAVPVFAEVDPDTYNLDLDDAATRITPRTRAIILVHQLGLPADIDGFTRLAGDAGLVLIEDAACAIGSRYRGRPIGAHGSHVCFSFHPRKLITTGDGGMIVVRRSDQADLLRRLRQHGMSVPDTVRHASDRVVRESYQEVGYNYRLTDIQAAVGREQLRRLPALLVRRRELAARYDQALAGHSVIATPIVPDDCEWNVQTYTVRLAGFGADRRDGVMQAMLDRGIATRPGVMTAHREPAYAARGVSLPVSEEASDRSLVLPLFSQMVDRDVDQVVTALRESVARA